MSELVIIPGQKIFVLHADLLCVDFDAGILDTSCMALLLALKSLRIPKYVQTEDGLMVKDEKGESAMKVLEREREAVVALGDW